MSTRLRRPQPDRSRIISSMGLPPRDPVPEPASPTYQQTFPRSRRDSNASFHRHSERSFNGRRPPADSDPYDTPRRDRSFRQRDADPRQDSRRRFESLPASRSRINSSRRPALPDFDDDRDHRDLDDLDEDDLEDDAHMNRRRGPNASRREEASRPAARSDRGGAALAERHRRQESDPHRQPEPYEDYSNASYNRREPTRSVSNGDLGGDYRRRSAISRSGKPSSYDYPEARGDDFDRSLPNDRSRSSRTSDRRSGGVLNRVLTRVSGGSRDGPHTSSSRMQRSSSSRLNRYTHMQPSGRRDDDEMELARIEEEEMLLAMQKRRSAANQATKGYNESDPRWYRDDRDSRTSASQPRNRAKAAGLERSPSAVRRSMDRERQRTLDALERADRQLPLVSRTDAVVRSRSHSKLPSRSESQSRPRDITRSRHEAAPHKSSREAALAAVTGVSASASAANAINKRARNGKAAQRDQHTESEISSDDDHVAQGAPEPADVHDDDAIPIIVAGSSKPTQNGKATPMPSSAAKKVAETTSDDDEGSDEDASDDESTEQTSEELGSAAEPVPAIPIAAAAPLGAVVSKSNSRPIATSANGSATPRGYMNLARKTPAVAAAAPLAAPAVKAQEPSDSDESEDSEDDEEETEDEQADTAPTPTRSRATPAAAIAAAVGGATVGAGALAAKRSAQAEKDQRRAAKLQAEQERKAAEAQARAAKADRSAEKRRAKKEASAAAAAAALAAKERPSAAKRSGRRRPNKQSWSAGESKSPKNAAVPSATRRKPRSDVFLLLAIRSGSVKIRLRLDVQTAVLPTVLVARRVVEV